MPFKDMRIVISGVGPVTPIGIGKDAVIDGILSRKTGLILRETKIIREIWDKSYVHVVNDFDINQFDIDADDLEYIKNWKEGDHNKDLLFLLAAVKLAIEDSNIDYLNKNHGLSIVVTHENPGLEQCLIKTYHAAFELYKKNEGLTEYDFFDEIFRRTMRPSYETQSFMTLFHIARTFHIKNYSLFINNACASGLYAIESASDLIRLGKAKQVIIVTGDCPDVLKTIWLKSIKMYQEDGKIKPFDKEAHGFVMGEGSVALVLEEYECAKKRGAHVYAEYLGGGFRLEGWGVITPMIGGQFYQETIKDAIKHSKIKIDDIDLICAHGVGTPSSDYYEAKAITDVFGELKVSVTALKPFVGHNLGGSNLMELVILLLGLEQKMIPPILNTKNLNSNLGLSLVTEEKKDDVKVFMKTCCAFAGYNAAGIFRR
jgi:3-oxoacyl-[acyl-carrier-protein] synthase II